MGKLIIGNRISTNALLWCEIWLYIWNLHPWITLDTNFLSIYTITWRIMTSGQFAPLLPIVAQVAGIDINKWKLLEDDLKRYISIQNYDSEIVKQISDYIIVFICGYATCATIGRSGANWPLVIIRQVIV